MSCCRVGVVERLGWRAGCKIYSSWRFGFLGQNSSSPVATFPLNHPLNLLSSLQLFPSVACASLNTQTLPCKSSRISRLGNSLVGNAWVCLGFVVAPVEHTRPSYRLPNPTAWQRWGWCRSMPLRPTGCEAAKLCSQPAHAHLYTRYVHTQSRPHRSTHSALTQTQIAPMASPACQHSHVHLYTRSSCCHHGHTDLRALVPLQGLHVEPQTHTHAHAHTRQSCCQERVGNGV